MGLLDHLKKIVTGKDKTYSDALFKTRSSITSKLINLGNKYKDINDDYFIELEELLITSDVSVSTTLKIINNLKDKILKLKITDPKEMDEVIVDELLVMYVNNDILTNKINYNLNGLTVILMVGVNGVGKTTSVAKLANYFKNNNKKVMMVAADTFRAGAIEQLKEWGKRLDISVFSKESTDPASVVFDSLDKALLDKYDVVLIDTAGRLQTKDNLMQELAKINRIIKSKVENAPHETLLVLDANTGQNGISQAISFKEITDITGIILTKLDSTAKGGIVLSIKDLTNLPVKFIGVGEKINDLKPFDIEKYLYNLVMEEKDEK